MLAKKQTLGELCRGLTIYPQVLQNVRVTDKTAAQKDPAVQAAINQVVNMLGNTGRILVRESGTEPVIRVMVEASTTEKCEDYVNLVVSAVKAAGYVK